MREKVIYTIETYNMINKGEGIVVGLSGGPDSACLIHVLSTLRSLYDIKLYAVHLNHMIRGEEADRDEKYSMELAKSLDIPFYSEHYDIPRYAKEKGMSEEEAGRHFRYKLFEKIAKQVGARKIAIAHNMNDQAETVMMHFLRGAGSGGLGGIRPVRDERFIRPLLFCTRQEIEEYCRENEIAPMIDSTNGEDIYARNKVRLEVIPYIQKNFNSNIIEGLSKSSQISRDEDDFMNQKAQIEIETLRRGEGLCVKDFNQLHIALKRRIIRILIQEARGSLSGIESKHIEDCIDIIAKARTGKYVMLPDDIVCRICYDAFIISKKVRYNDYEYTLSIPGSLYIPERDVHITTRIIDKNNQKYSDDRFIKYFDYGKINKALKVRNRRDGDYILPRGMNGTKKIKDLFIDKKLPSQERSLIPLVAMESEILWIPQIRDTRNYKPDMGTEKLLEIKIER